VQYVGTCAGAACKVIGVEFITVYRAKGCGMLLVRVTTISRSDFVGTVQSMQVFSIHHTDSCLCLIRIEAANLAQAGFGDTS
jgi:hypothetical protein